MNDCPSQKSLKRVFQKEGLVHIIVREKHGNREAIAKTEEGFCKYFLDLLSERLKDGYWYCDPNLKENQPELPSIGREEAEKMPPGRPRVAAFEDCDRYNQFLKIHREDLQWWTLVNKALAEKDGWTAYICLAERSCNGYEYESLHITFPTVV